MDWFALIGCAVGVLGPLISFLVADARSKARLDSMFNESETLKKALVAAQTERTLITNRQATVDAFVMRSEQDRNELRRLIDRLDDSKASKEIFESFRSEFVTLRADFDKRFDRLERLLEGHHTK